MTEQGSKRPRDEHAWNSVQCSRCEVVPSTPFRVLNPKCVHGVCDACILRCSSEHRCCFACFCNWNFKYQAYPAPDGTIVVATRTPDGGAFYEKTVRVFGRDSGNTSRLDVCTCTMEMLVTRHPELRTWCYEVGLLKVPDMSVAVAKAKRKLGDGARDVPVRAQAVVVFTESAVRGSWNVRYISSENGKYKICMVGGLVRAMKIAVPVGILADILRAVEGVREASADE